ncbi:MAG: GNAT family N-acetyltransferase [Candidatus Acidiferrales bacterium]
MFRIEIAEAPEFVAIARKLFIEYSESLEVDLCFQGFAEELARLPGEYVRPAGRLFVAFDQSEEIGCGALRPIDRTACEMKRLYIRPAFRGKGAGGATIDALVCAARETGYQRMRLDTLPMMATAIGMYRSLGFKEIPPYRHNPVPGALYFELDLQKST